jgi:CAP12/Pycsar effector protein, TIR domain
VLTPDDLISRRGKTGNSPRDNVLFELGLFMGALGRVRTFMVGCRDDDLDLPSDLAGVKIASFRRHSDDNLRAALGPVCTQLKQAMRTLGLRPERRTRARPKGNDGTGQVRLLQQSVPRPPVSPPHDYQLSALRQLVAHLKQSGVKQLTSQAFAGVIATDGLRDGVNPMFEPLPFANVREALDALVRSGELVKQDDDSFVIA